MYEDNKEINNYPRECNNTENEKKQKSNEVQNVGETRQEIRHIFVYVYLIKVLV